MLGKDDGLGNWTTMASCAGKDLDSAGMWARTKLGGQRKDLTPDLKVSCMFLAHTWIVGWLWKFLSVYGLSALYIRVVYLKFVIAY